MKLIKLRQKKHSIFYFFKTSFNNRAIPVIVELHEDTLYSFVRFELQSFSSIIEKSFENTNTKKVKMLNKMQTKNKRKGNGCPNLLFKRAYCFKPYGTIVLYYNPPYVLIFCS